MVLNDKFFNRDVEIKKCFENGVPLVKFDIETNEYLDCENPNFDDADALKIKLPEYVDDENMHEEFLEKNKDLLAKLHYKDERYIIFKIDYHDPYEIIYENLSYAEMINRRIEYYAFKGTNHECEVFYNEFFVKNNHDYYFIHRRFPNYDIKEFINQIKYVYHSDINWSLNGEELNELYNLLYVNNEVWENFKKEQRHKELEEKDKEFNENLIYHMADEEKE